MMTKRPQTARCARVNDDGRCHRGFGVSEEGHVDEVTTKASGHPRRVRGRLEMETRGWGSVCRRCCGGTGRRCTASRQPLWWRTARGGRGIIGQRCCTAAARARRRGGAMLGMEAGMASPSLVVASMATASLGEEWKARATGEGDADGAGSLRRAG
jgi:hypothetical protein